MLPCLKHHPAEVGRRQAEGEIGDVRFLEGYPAGRTGLTLAEVLKRARLTEKVAALCAKACAIGFLRAARGEWVSRRFQSWNCMTPRSPLSLK